MMDIHAILKQLPHRYPFLLVDKVLELESNQRIKAIKNVTFNEPYFQGHFPGRPVMPGVLMLEALAQAAGLLAFDAMGKVRAKDVVDLDFEPGRGLVMYVNATLRAGPIPGEDFYAALLRSFVGEHVYDDKMRAGLLGRKP